jgi:hypothetical protein
VTSLAQLGARLSHLSQECAAAPLDWPETLGDSWCFSPELISIAGTPAWDALSEAERRKLSFHEAVAFFSINIHGEKSLIAGLAERLYASPATEYLHHFLDEENQHSRIFGRFCTRYAGRVYPERKLVFPREYARGEEDFLFFAKILVFEEIVDHYNVAMAADARLHPLVRGIHAMHHEDESRHLAFGRVVVETLFHEGGFSAEVVAGIRAYLAAYLGATFQEYHSVDAYRDAGLPSPLALAQSSFRSPAALARRRAAGKKCVAGLIRSGVLVEDPL